MAKSSLRDYVLLPQFTSLVPMNYHLPNYSLDSSSLPSPSNEEVVSYLVKQRNIFPVLEPLQRLFSGTELPNALPATTRSCSPPLLQALMNQAMSAVPLQSIGGSTRSLRVPLTGTCHIRSNKEKGQANIVFVGRRSASSNFSPNL